MNKNASTELHEYILSLSSKEAREHGIPTAFIYGATDEEAFVQVKRWLKIPEEVELTADTFKQYGGSSLRKKGVQIF
jgi:hypothetical protein